MPSSKHVILETILYGMFNSVFQVHDILKYEYQYSTITTIKFYDIILWTELGPNKSIMLDWVSSFELIVVFN